MIAEPEMRVEGRWRGGAGGGRREGGRDGRGDEREIEGDAGEDPQLADEVEDKGFVSTLEFKPNKPCMCLSARDQDPSVQRWRLRSTSSQLHGSSVREGAGERGGRASEQLQERKLQLPPPW